MDFYTEATEEMDRRLGIGISFDMKRRILRHPSGKEISYYSAAGLSAEEPAERLLTYLMVNGDPAVNLVNLPHGDVTLTGDKEVLIAGVISGRGVILLSGSDYGAVADVKSFPLRSVEEPENDKVLRGPRDGFGESLVRNTAMIRRRLRDPGLRMEKLTVASPASMDTVLCYVEGKANEKFLNGLREKLNGITVKSLNMNGQSLAECLIQKGWYNPFPKIRYTERPDAAAAALEEGSILLLCDNSPGAMILPTGILDFLQQTDDFYFPPLVGTYLRIVRFLIFLLALVLTPLWYLALKTPDTLPYWLSFIEINEPAAVPLLFQLLLAEFMIDGLKLASLNTPSMLSNSLSVVGGLILGDYAVEAGWFSSQTILYMAIVAIAAFTQQSYELGYAFKFLRILLLLAVEFFGIWGFLGGILLAILTIALNKTVDGSRSYLYPLIPWNGEAMKRMFFRVRLKDK